jgi:nitrile hydratase
MTTFCAEGAFMAEHDHDDHHHQHGSELSETQLRVRALETVLTEKGYIDPAALDAIIEAYETKVGPHNGARVVAKAWSDPAFRRDLLADASKAVSGLGHESRVGDHLVAVENTLALHNMIVCTLCSCYPWEVLGLPPVWYKSAPYRSRAVKDPRGVLADFGVSLPKDTEIRVWDSTAETRFLVLPMRPPGTEGWSEERLAQLVTRDSMIGTGLAKRPEEVA